MNKGILQQIKSRKFSKTTKGCDLSALTEMIDIIKTPTKDTGEPFIGVIAKDEEEAKSKFEKIIKHIKE